MDAKMAHQKRGARNPVLRKLSIIINWFVHVLMTADFKQGMLDIPVVYTVHYKI